MLFDLPDDDTLYAALLARDPDWDGRAYVGVTSTGIFCRLTCPARKPLRQNCRFFETVGACLEAGFRPCRRCHPITSQGGNDPQVSRLLAALEAEPARRWREQDIAAMGIDPSTARRAFRRAFGVTFLEMARLTRLRRGFEALGAGQSVIDAQLTAGFESPSAFREAFARLLGAGPSRFTEDAPLKADWIDTPLGPMIAVSDNHALHLLEFADRRALLRELDRLRRESGGALGIGRPAPIAQAARELAAYFEGQSARFDVRLALHGTPFERAVWQALRDIPAGQTETYGDLALRLGRPTASRAVARANGANSLAIIVPCHRVIGADGSLTGYGGGLWRKQRLIEIERAHARRQTAAARMS